MTDTVDALARAMSSTFSDGADGWRLVPMTLDGGIAPATPAGVFADPILVALAAEGLFIVKTAEDAARGLTLREAAQRILAAALDSGFPEDEIDSASSFAMSMTMRGRDLHDLREALG